MKNRRERRTKRRKRMCEYLKMSRVKGNYLGGMYPEFLLLGEGGKWVVEMVYRMGVVFEVERLWVRMRSMKREIGKIVIFKVLTLFAQLEK